MNRQAAARIAGIGRTEPAQAEATKTLTPAGEEDLKVWEFTIDLRVVALKGSVPNQWVEDFKEVKHRSSLAVQAKTKSCKPFRFLAIWLQSLPIQDMLLCIMLRLVCRL